jgi:hypothetical protein
LKSVLESKQPNTGPRLQPISRSRRSEPKSKPLLNNGRGRSGQALKAAEACLVGLNNRDQATRQSAIEVPKGDEDIDEDGLVRRISKGGVPEEKP